MTGDLASHIKQANKDEKTTECFKIKNKLENYMFIKTDSNTVDDQLNRLIDLSEAEDDNEEIPLNELEASEAAWQDYLSSRDLGESLNIVRQELVLI